MVPILKIKPNSLLSVVSPRTEEKTCLDQLLWVDICEYVISLDKSNIRRNVDSSVWTAMYVIDNQSIHAWGWRMLTLDRMPCCIISYI